MPLHRQIETLEKYNIISPKIVSAERNQVIETMHRLCQKHSQPSIPIINRLSEFDIIHSNETGIGNIIYLARHKIDEKKYVIKQIPYVPGVEREAIIHSSLDHPNTVRYHTCWYEILDGNRYMMIQIEACDGDIDELNGELNEQSEVFDVVDQVSNGLQYLHAKGIIHRDIKLANILYKRENKNKRINVKIADFGSAHQVTSNNSGRSRKKTTRMLNLSDDIGTELYSAPEIESSNYNEKVDNYSLGLLMYELMVKPTQICKLLEFNQFRKDRSSLNKEQWMKVVKKMLEPNPNRRLRLITFRHCLNKLHMNT